MTTDLQKRADTHNRGRGSAYVRSRGGGTIIYNEPFPDKNSALRREAEVKKWPKRKKELLLAEAV